MIKLTLNMECNNGVIAKHNSNMECNDGVVAKRQNHRFCTPKNNTPK